MKKTFLIILLGTFVLMIIGFYNGYPLVYSDTGTYIYSGFDKFVPNDRPITYGLFLWFFSFRFSLWLVILVQNFLTAYVLFELLKFFLKQKSKTFTFFYLAILLFLTLFTGIGWYSNQLMPDFFTPIMILTLALLIFNNGLKSFKRGFLCLILVISIIMHLSHLLISLFLIISYLIAERILYKKGIIAHCYMKFSMFGLLLSLIIFSWFSLSLIHYSFGGGFKVSKSSNIFLVAHLADTGLLDKYLKEKCNDPKFKPYKLCECKDSLPNNIADFLWGRYAPYDKPGLWEKGELECKELVKQMAKSPHYLFLNAYKSSGYGCIQLFKNEIGQGLTAYNQGSPPYSQIQWRFNDELNSYKYSRQNSWNGVNLNLNTLNTFHLTLLICSLFIGLFILFVPTAYKSLNTDLFLFLIFSLLAIIINSFITAGLVSPCERFQARVVWLLPLSLLIIIINNPNIFKQGLK